MIRGGSLVRIKPGIRFGETWGNIDDDGVLDAHWLVTTLFGFFSAAVHL